MSPARAVIHTQNFRHNLRQVRELAGEGRKICAAVKADAYGHGAVPLARIALEEGVSHLGVATLSEAAALRDAGIRAPLLLFSLLVPEDWKEGTALDLEPLAAGESYLQGLAEEARRQGKVLKVHLKVDTGMGRIGCSPGEAPAQAALISRLEGLQLAGTCTHFPLADTADPEYTRRQMQQFQGVLEALRSQNTPPGLVHAANSAALLTQPSTYGDMVRPGIMLYGCYPSRELSRPRELKPVMEFRAPLVFKKKVKAGCPIGYGHRWTAPRDTEIGTIAAGYADGFNRLLSNKGEVLLGGKRCPVAGRVCMDQFMVDLGPCSQAKLYEEAVLFGPRPPAPAVEDMALLVGSIPYEITCRIDKRVPRIYV